MQGFLTESLLSWLVQVGKIATTKLYTIVKISSAITFQADVSLRDQANSLEQLQSNLVTGLAAIQVILYLKYVFFLSLLMYKTKTP